MLKDLFGLQKKENIEPNKSEIPNLLKIKA